MNIDLSSQEPIADEAKPGPAYPAQSIYLSSPANVETEPANVETDALLLSKLKILREIESLVLELITNLHMGVLMDFEMPLAGRNKRQPLPMIVPENELEGKEMPDCLTTRISFTARHGVLRYTRIVKMLATMHELVRTGRTAPQREIYYILKGTPLFETPANANNAIEDVAALLQVAKADLGITTSTKGLVFGQLLLKVKGDQGWTDCSSHVRHIPGDCALIQDFTYETTAKSIVIVEKDAVFQRLANEGFTKASSSILVTAKGMPDIATRVFLHGLVSVFPYLKLAAEPVASGGAAVNSQFGAVVDWNPSGVVILKTYKYGGQKIAQGAQYALPSLKWLALHAEQVDNLPEDAFQELTEYDRRTIVSLRDSTVHIPAEWRREVQVMAENGIKAETEAVYKHSSFGEFSRKLAYRLEAGLYF